MRNTKSQRSPFKLHRSAIGSKSGTKRYVKFDLFVRNCYVTVYNGIIRTNTFKLIRIIYYVRYHYFILFYLFL